MAKLWQHPFVNIFKIFGVGDWKKCSREGAVSTLTDKIVKSTVYKISGSVPAGNYIQFPRTSSQSLGLTGNFFYLLFKPIPTKHFVVHLDVVSEDDLVIRISFSNLFREFKSTSTWLQFPYVANVVPGSVEELTLGSLKGEFGVASTTTRWTLLCLDLHYILSIYLNKTFGYLKSFRLCANMLVKNVFTSSSCYEPGIDIKTARKQGLLASGVVPLPREMNFALQQGDIWFQKYDHVKFPAGSGKSLLLNAFPGKAPSPSGKARGSPGIIKSSRGTPSSNGYFNDRDAASRKVKANSKIVSAKQRSKDSKEKRKFPHQALPDIAAEGIVNLIDVENAVHINAHPAKEINVRPKTHVEEGSPKQIREESRVAGIEVLKSIHPRSNIKGNQSLHPDPILTMRKIIGFGGASDMALWTKDGKYVVYPCHSVIVSMEVASGKQHFFIGHTDKIAGIAFNGTSTLLASVQTGVEAILRVWKFTTKRCLVLRQTHMKDPSCLSFSKSGSRLCVVGWDSHNRQVVTVWDTSVVDKSGRISVIGKAHTDVCIRRLIFTPFDDSRLVSCGQDNLRFWKVKQGLLRSTPMDLGQYQYAELTDIAFEVMNRLVEDPTDRKLYATSQLGSLLVINYKKMVLSQVLQLLPFGSKAIVMKRDITTTDTNISLNCLSLTDSFCAIGSGDGFLRLWPLNFSRPFLEAEHEGPISTIKVSPDGTRVLGATSTGSIGVLNISSKSYLTLMRSHLSQVVSFAFDTIREHLVTVSSDESIRVWSLKPINQLYDFRAPSEKPTVVACHPTRECIACGFTNGYVRVFDVSSTNLLAEHNYHKGHILSVLFSPDGSHLYSAGSKGGLAVYDSTQEGFSLVRLSQDVLVHDLEATCPAMTINDTGKRLACIGPTEFMITVLNARTLDELLRIDITSMARNAPKSMVDFAIAVCYAPDFIGHLLVATSSSRLIKLDANTGHLLSEIAHIHRGLVTAITVSANGKYLATAGDRLIKIWDYKMNLEINFQVFIGHSDPISQILFTKDGSKLVSAGEAVFVWDFLGTKKRPPSSITDTFQVYDTKMALNVLTFVGSVEQLLLRMSASAVTSQHSCINAKEESQVPDALLKEAWEEPSSLNDFPRETVPLPEKYDRRDTEAEIDDTSVISSCDDGDEEEGVIVEIAVDDVDNDRPPTENQTDADLIQDVVDANDVRPEEQLTAISYHVVPTVFSHFKKRYTDSKLATKRFVAPPHQAGLKLKSIMGYNGNGRQNVIWNPDTDLSTNKQRHLRHHVEEISTLAAQHDGQVLASSAAAGPSSANAQICIWEVSTGLCRLAFEHHKGAVQAMQYSRDDRFLLSVGNYQDCTVALWNARDYSLVTSSFTKHPIHSIQWDPFTVNEFASVGQNGTLLFWLLDETKRKFSLHVHDASVPRELMVEDSDVVFDFTSLSFTGNSVLFVGSSQGILSAWDTRRNTCFMHWEADTDEISIIVAKMGRLITGSGSGSLKLWSLEAIADLREPVENTSNHLRINRLIVDDEMKLDGSFTSAVFDDALEMGIVGTEVGTIWYVNWDSKSSVRLISGHKSQVNDAQFFPSCDQFFGTTADDGTLRLWSNDTFEQTLQFLVLGQTCNCLSFRPCHESVATSYQTGSQAYNSLAKPIPSELKPRHCVAGYSDGTVRMFDLEKVEMVLRMKPHTSAVTAVAFSVDGCVIISGSEDGLIAVSSPATGITMRVLQSQKGAPITCIRISTHEHLVHATISPLLWLAASADRRVSIWSSDWSKDVCELVDWMTFPAPNFAPDGSVRGKDLKSWYSRLPPSMACFSPTEPDIIIYTGYSVQKQISFYSLSKKQVVRSLSLTCWALSMDVSPDGNFIAVGCQDRVVKLIDYYEGVFQDFSCHSDSVRLVKFSPTGQLLFSVGCNDIVAWTVAV